MLQFDAASGQVVSRCGQAGQVPQAASLGLSLQMLEDRINNNNAGSPSSDCFPAGNPLPVSTLLSSSSGTQWIGASWTRPLSLSSDLLRRGYFNIPTGMSRSDCVVYPAFNACNMPVLQVPRI